MASTLKQLASMLWLASGVALLHAAPRYEVVDRIALGGDGHWDYLTVDSAAHRLYVSHSQQTDVVDTSTGQKVGTIAPTAGVHGIAIARDLGRGFTSNGKDNSVTVFDLITLATVATIEVGANPDAIVYEPRSGRVLAFNGKSRDVSVIDARRQVVVATLALGAKPEFAQVGRSGTVYVNLEDTNQLAAIDPATPTLLYRRSLAPCESPTGLAIDDQDRLYSVCENKTMIVSAADGARIAQVPIGAGADGVAWLDGAAYSANGADGTVTQVELDAVGQVVSVATMQAAVGARTIAADTATRRLYLPTVAFAPSMAEGRRVGRPDSFHVLVLGPK